MCVTHIATIEVLDMVDLQSFGAMGEVIACTRVDGGVELFIDGQYETQLWIVDEKSLALITDVQVGDTIDIGYYHFFTPFGDMQQSKLTAFAKL